MRQQLAERLESLKAEFARGQEQLAQVDAQSSQLRQMLLRISGAIQVLEEELSKADNASGEGGTSVASPGS